MNLTLSRPYVVIGGVATRAYMPERTTDDLDILINTHDRTRIHADLTAAGFTYLQELGVIPGSSWRSPDGEILDVLERSDGWVNDALRVPNRQADGTPVIPRRYLVLMKLESGRGRDIGDLTQLLGYANDDELAQVRQTIAQWLPNAAEDLESLIQLGKLELQ